jgi:Secretion system C-terminal sorting domain
MKRIYATLLFAALFAATSFAQIVAGDIAFTGVNTSGTDDFSFICLKNIPANTEIRFTDGGWKAAGGFRCNENDMSWNSGSSVILSGTQVRLSLTPTASHGSFTAYSMSSLCNVSPAVFLGLATDADQIFAYTGTFSSPTLIAAINISPMWDTDAISAQTSANPNIIGGLNLVLNTTFDNAVFMGSLTGTRAQILAALNDVTQWTKTNATVVLPAAGSVALSVELTAFQAIINQNNAILTWKTASEKDNDHFNVEHSTDGLAFEKVGEVKGNGTTSEAKNYTFTQPNLAQNVVHYYRLNQINLDGKASITNVVSVEFKDDKTSKNWVKIYPTNATNEVIVEGINPEHSDINLTIFDAFGRVLLTEKRLYTEGSLFEKIEVTNFNSGFYFLTVKSGESVKTLKFFKQ